MFKLGARASFQDSGCSGLEELQGTSLLLLGEPVTVGSQLQFILQALDHGMRLLLQGIFLICEGHALIADSPKLSGMLLLLLGKHFPYLGHVCL